MRVRQRRASKIWRNASAQKQNFHMLAILMLGCRGRGFRQQEVHWKASFAASGISRVIQSFVSAFSQILWTTVMGFGRRLVCTGGFLSTVATSRNTAILSRPLASHMSDSKQRAQPGRTSQTHPSSPVKVHAVDSRVNACAGHHSVMPSDLGRSALNLHACGLRWRSSRCSWRG